MDLNKRIAKLLDHLAEKHDELADLLESSTDPKHAVGDKALAEAERKSASTCARVAASIRSRLTDNKR
jgi:hypothetical protein